MRNHDPIQFVGRIAIFLVVLFTFGLGIYGCNLSYSNERTIRGEVAEKYIKRVSKESDKFRVVIKLPDGNLETFLIEDDLYYGVWNSADIYARLESNSSYEFKVVGTRWQFASMFPRILKAEKVNQK